jgi:hypothetical protein
MDRAQSAKCCRESFVVHQQRSSISGCPHPVRLVVELYAEPIVISMSASVQPHESLAPRNLITNFAPSNTTAEEFSYAEEYFATSSQMLRAVRPAVSPLISGCVGF